MNFPLDELRFFSSRMGPVREPGMRTAGGDDDLDTVKELEDAMDDLQSALDTPKVSGYETKVRKELLTKSVSQDYDTAKKEWGIHKKWVDPKGGKCELCGHVPIIYQFQIKNKHNANELVIGSECILNYVEIEGFSADDLKKYLTRLRKRLKDLRFDAVTKEMADVWDKQDEVHASLKKLVALDPDLNILDFYHRIYRFSRMRDQGYQTKDVYATYIRQVGTMARIMDKVYGATVLKQVPDKIQRKQKIDGVVITDQKRLELYIEFETILKVLFKFGTPSEAYNMILDDYKGYLRGIADTANGKRADVIAKVNSLFDGYKGVVGTRHRLKDYIDSWCNMVEGSVTEDWALYLSKLSDIDAIMTGRVWLGKEPSGSGIDYVRNTMNSWNTWRTRPAGEQNLWQLIAWFPKFSYSTSNSMGVPTNHPILQVKSIPADDLQSALFTCLDRDEVPIKDLTQLYISQQQAIISSTFIANHSKMMERLLADSPEVRKYIDSTAKAEADARQQLQDAEADRLKAEREAKEAQAKVEKEFSDMLDDADIHTDPNKSFEKKFIEDLRTQKSAGGELRYKAIKDLSPRQLSWLKSIATRRTIPQQAPPDASAARVQQQATPAPVAVPASGGHPTHLTFPEFIDACKTTLHVGREDGFVEQCRKRYKVWSQLSPKQQKWLMDIYVRNGRPVPVVQ